MELTIDTPRWALPLQQNTAPDGTRIRYKGAYGGRGSGKSHELATMVVEEMIADPNCSVVCIREVQKSLALSAKKLIESKIESMGVGHLFDVLRTEIRRIGGDGLCIFQGMQDHTADSVKSLEGFRIAWVEEAQSLSERSMRLLRPTIRAEGSQIWFSWNPRRRSDPVDKLLRGRNGPRSDAIVVRANYTDNPFLPETLRLEAEADKHLDPDNFAHTWLGDYEGVGSKAVIPPLWVQSAIGLVEDLGLEVTGQKYSALDVAGAEEGGDQNALAIRKGVELLSLNLWNGMDTAATTQRAVKANVEARAKLAFYDSVSVGEGVTGEWGAMGRRGERPEGYTLTAWNGGAAVLNPDKPSDPDNKESPLNKDQYHNLKAQGWMALRKRFQNAHKARMGMEYDADNLISIPRNIAHLSQLEEELSQPQIQLSATGKTMVDKQPDNSASPNLADAVMMAFWPVTNDKPKAQVFL